MIAVFTSMRALLNSLICKLRGHRYESGGVLRYGLATWEPVVSSDTGHAFFYPRMEVRCGRCRDVTHIPVLKLMVLDGREVHKRYARVKQDAA
jgi:hypothetical protein